MPCSPQLLRVSLWLHYWNLLRLGRVWWIILSSAMQVLVHENTVNLFESSPSDDWTLTDMGRHNFKGLSNRARIFQVLLMITLSLRLHFSLDPNGSSSRGKAAWNFITCFPWYYELQNPSHSCDIVTSLQASTDTLSRRVFPGIKVSKSVSSFPFLAPLMFNNLPGSFSSSRAEDETDYEGQEMK